MYLFSCTWLASEPAHSETVSHRGRGENKKGVDSEVCVTSWAREPKRALVSAARKALIWLAAEHVPEACCSTHRVYSGQRRVADGPVHCAYSALYLGNTLPVLTLLHSLLCK